MAEISGFHNSVNGDRRVKADFFARFFGSLIGNGVFPNPSTCLQVIANGDMTVTVKAGKGWVNGVFYENTSDKVITLDVADGVLKRIDRIVVSDITLERDTYIKVKKGTFASTPVAPALQRDADAHELGLADIYIVNGAVSISQANITDLRLNSAYCGIVHGLVDQVDTTTLFNQYQAWIAEKQTQFNSNLVDYAAGKQIEIDQIEANLLADWNVWFATIQNALSGDTAGNLLNMINDNTDDIAVHTTAISNLKTFQTATGTATAITLTGVELVNGFQLTFVVLSSNNGAATTINTKPLYKPGTTTAPKLIAGKAATVWYNTAGGCFFIKASAEGTAVAGDVLASKTFSSDDDTGLSGTMANRGAVAITPSATQQAIAAGYHNGSGYVAGSANLVADNIASGVNVFGVNGTIQKPYAKISDFPALGNIPYNNATTSKTHIYSVNNGNLIKQDRTTGTFISSFPVTRYNATIDITNEEIVNHSGVGSFGIYNQSGTFLRTVTAPSNFNTEGIGCGATVYAGRYFSGNPYPYLIKKDGTVLGYSLDYFLQSNPPVQPLIYGQYAYYFPGSLDQGVLRVTIPASAGVIAVRWNKFTASTAFQNFFTIGE